MYNEHYSDNDDESNNQKIHTIFRTSKFYKCMNDEVYEQTITPTHTHALKLSCVLRRAIRIRHRYAVKSSHGKTKVNGEKWNGYFRAAKRKIHSNYPFSMSFVADNMPAENPTKSIQYTRHLPYIRIRIHIHSLAPTIHINRALPPFTAPKKPKNPEHYGGRKIF